MPPKKQEAKKRPRIDQAEAQKERERLMDEAKAANERMRLTLEDYQNTPIDFHLRLCAAKAVAVAPQERRSTFLDEVAKVRMSLGWRGAHKVDGWFMDALKNGCPEWLDHALREYLTPTGLPDPPFAEVGRAKVEAPASAAAAAAEPEEFPVCK